MADLDELVPEIHLEAPNCHHGIIRKQLQATLRHFCKETYLWRYQLPAITLLPFNESAPSTYLYELDVPDDTEVIAIHELIYQNRNLLPKSTDWLTTEMSNWRESTGDPRYYLQLSDRRVRFVPASEEVQPIAITGQVILQPSRKGETFCDELLEYDHALIQGTLARLLAMGKKPWSDPQRVQYCQLEYGEAISQAKHNTLRDYSDGAETIARRSWL